MLANKYYQVNYIPNKTVYVYEITKTEIKFIAFFKEKDSEFKAISHNVPIKSKKDFKPVKDCFNPTDIIKDLVNSFINSK